MTWQQLETVSVVLLNTIIAFCYGHIAGLSFVTGWLVCVLFATFKRHESKQDAKRESNKETQTIRIDHDPIHI